jgi:DNA-directed RNA polymerase subunit alpha
LAVNPNNPRARLYLKDVTAAHGRLIDEQEVRAQEKRNAVLDIPVTDFELSVRSRNCLKKMNIFSLGDLLKTTETELLAYKNFGETSLREIKAMLSQKGLALGQCAEQKAGSPAPSEEAATPTHQGDPVMLAKPVSSLDLSVRSRKCLQRLGISTIGELVAKSETELLNSRNFGLTSLGEIKTCLIGLEISLRSDEERAV